jgi:hypothetical protein
MVAANFMAFLRRTTARLSAIRDSRYIGTVKVWHALLIAGLILWLSPNRWLRLLGIFLFLMFLTIVAPGGT